MRIIAVIAAASLAAATPLLGQAGDGRMETVRGTGTPADVKAGHYLAEPDHTQVVFSVSHMGITPFAGTFAGASGSLDLDPARLQATRLSVTIPVASVQTTVASQTAELKGPGWLDAARFPTATFVASSVSALGEDAAKIDGMLTLHGVSRPVIITARFFGSARNPYSGKDSVGFLGRAVIHRSEFGIGKDIPMVSDETLLIFNAAFERQP